jgi:hypothetical protein
MDFLTILIPAILLLALCFLGMAVGVIFRNKSFKSCGCGSLTVRGERIDCPGHVPDAAEGDARERHQGGCCCHGCRDAKADEVSLHAGAVGTPAQDDTSEPAYSAR